MRPGRKRPEVNENEGIWFTGEDFIGVTGVPTTERFEKPGNRSGGGFQDAERGRKSSGPQKTTRAAKGIATQGV